ncbi:phosphate ABC transporter permease PstA [Methanolobus zinderi]|uniref:Phosphate transport system permease protein PstA n=1 Tax=Methanolobus zinderi TaxID=536044 RepID=A0A7D5E8D6_9EURY|nr:phosphate ABC transporter permease PstA [Methanolobus zinderi]QLC49395.1 phosphate ABC transporter permease PstA [Methanolobus zinderi]QLC49508.1 phosphate ABC transporter permease PstA [Methanolobus zinderi]
MEIRRIEELIFRVLMILSLAIVVSSLLTVIGIILWKGLPALSLDMLTKTAEGGYYLGKGGGILNAIIGSLYLASASTILAFFLSIGIAFYLQKEYSGGTKLSNLTRLSLDILWGTPSIVYGAFGFTILMLFHMRASLLGGIIVLTLLELPIMTRSMEEVIKTVPYELKEASFSLGATRLETVQRVVAKQALPGLMTGVLIAFGRGIGDAASVLFTAGYTDRIPTSLFDATASLPLAIFFQLGTPLPQIQQKAYASAIILLIIILVINITARILSRKYARYIIK